MLEWAHDLERGLIPVKKISAAIIIVVLIAMVGATFSGCLSKKEADASKLLASVNNTRITEKAVDTRISIFKLFYGPSIDTPEIREKLLDQLIDEALLAQEGLKLKVSVSKDELNKEFSTFKEQMEFQFGGKEQATAELKKINVTDNDLRAFIETYMLMQNVYKKITEKVTVPDQDLAKFYEERKNDFVQEEKVRARHILVETKQQADKILSEIKAGKDFAELAKEHSTCPSSQQGGDLSYFGRGEMDETFEKAAFALQVGQVSGVVQTRFGFHIIKVEERSPMKQLTFDEVKGEILEMLLEERKSEVFENRLRELQNKAKINKPN